MIIQIRFYYTDPFTKQLGNIGTLETVCSSLSVKVTTIEVQLTNIKQSVEGTNLSNKDRLKSYKKEVDKTLDANSAKITALENSLKGLGTKYTDLEKRMVSGKAKISESNASLNSSGESNGSSKELNSPVDGSINNNKDRSLVSRLEFTQIKKRINELEMINPLSGFFAWTVRNFDTFRAGNVPVKREAFKTACFGYECQIVLYWNDLDSRRSVNLGFEVLGRTPMTVSFLPFFCDVVLSVVSADGAIMTREISCTEFAEATSEQNWDCLCRAVVEDFLVFPDHDSFVCDDVLKMFGYFKPFDPSVEIEIATEE